MNAFLNIIILCLAVILLPKFYNNDEITSFFITLFLLIGLIINIIKKIYIFFNGKYYYDNCDLEIYDNYCKQNNILNNSLYYAKRGIKKKQINYNNVLKELENKCKIKNSRIEIINYTNNIHQHIEDLKYKTKLIECKTSAKASNLIPIKQIVLNKDNEKQIIEFSDMPRLTIKLNEDKIDTQINSSNKTKDVIMIINEYDVDNNRQGVYNTIIDLFKRKKYSTSKTYRLLKSIQYIDLLPAAINIYINYAELNDTDDIPMLEIKEELKKVLHCNNLQVLFLKYKHTNIFEYYLLDKFYNE